MQYIKILSLSTILLSAVITSCTPTDNKVENETSANLAPTTGNATAAVQQMPAFTLMDVSGKTIDLKSFAGKKVFVNLWATWCPPCRREMPSIEKLAQSVDTGKVAFVMLSLDDEFAKAKQFVKKQKLDLPIYYPAESLPELFNVQGIPSTFIFDEQSILMQRIDGGDDYDTKQYRDILK